MRYITTATLIVAALISGSATAADYKIGAIEIMAPWSRATPKGVASAIGYMTIKNTGTTPDRLVGGSVDFARGFQLHSMVMEGDVSKMRDLEGVDVAPGQTIEFKPGGSHVMFVGLERPLAEGEHVKGTLVFAHAGTVQIEYDVQGIGAQTAPQSMGRMDHMEH
jgi:periplasmic copper chaperone A